MGSARQRPERLAEKLRQVRLSLGLTQSEMVRRLGAEDQIDAARISGFETGLREPSLTILLNYARLANVYLDALVDDTRDLPARLPAPHKTEGSRPKSVTKRRRR